MSKSWHKTESDTEADKHAKDFWSRHKTELDSGEFWADRIKKMKGEPIKRLSLALDNKPLPASFREAAVAIRSLIKEKRKSKESYEDELALLYWLAAINSFSIPYSDVLQEPGYNVIESIHGKILKNMSFTYDTLGFKKLALLNKTDIKWIVEEWGEPNKHATLHDIHIDVWREYEEKLRDKMLKRRQEFIKSIKKLSCS